jgi:perosamine synthetase
LSSPAAEIVEAVRAVLPHRRPLHHHEPSYGALERRYACECIDAGLEGLSFVHRLEAALRTRCGVSQALALSSGTAALQLALLASGVAPGEEVLVPSMTYVATANAVVHAGAVPHFYDASTSISPFSLRQYLAMNTTSAPDRRARVSASGRLITTIVVVHLLGLPADVAVLAEVAGEFGLRVVEDACQALGSSRGGRPCGSVGVAAALSFNSNKVVSAGGGGALLTNDEELVDRAWKLSTASRVPHPWEIDHDAVAWNFRIPPICAALALAQLEHLDALLARKSAVAGAYLRGLAGARGCEFAAPLPGSNSEPAPVSNNWLVTLLTDEARYPGLRDEVMRGLHDDQVLARGLFKPLHTLPMFSASSRSSGPMHSATSLWKRGVCLPSGPELML